jgi:hypothetical protein
MSTEHTHHVEATETITATVRHHTIAESPTNREYDVLTIRFNSPSPDYNHDEVTIYLTPEQATGLTKALSLAVRQAHTRADHYGKQTILPEIN